MTKKVLLVENNLTLDTMYSLNLNVYVGVDVISKKNHQLTFDLIKNNEHLALIIAKNIIGEDKTALEIYRFVQSLDRSIPMIVIGEEPLLEGHATILPEKTEVSELIKMAANILGVTAKEMAKKIVPDYFPIPIEFFLSIDNLSCPAFVQMNTSKDPYYIPKFHEGDNISLAIIEELVKKGITKLYIPKEQRLQFTQQLTSVLIERLDDDEIDDSERATLTSNSIEIIRDQLQSAGLSEETIILARKSLKSISTLVEKSSALREMLNKLLNAKGSYRYRAAQLTTFISFHALRNLEWGSSEQQDKLAFVALFHDMTLEKDAWAGIRTEEQLKKACLDDQDLTNVRSHALEAAKIVEQFPKSPLGAEIVIKQHHGSATGMGYVKNFSNNLSPLAIVFILSEDYAHYLLTTPKDEWNHKSLMAKLYERYPKAMYRKVLKSLENINLLQF